MFRSALAATPSRIAKNLAIELMASISAPTPTKQRPTSKDCCPLPHFKRCFSFRHTNIGVLDFMAVAEYSGLELCSYREDASDAFNHFRRRTRSYTGPARPSSRGEGTIA